ncbi:Porin OmpC [Serratia fonticola]|uniref:Porin OmpC n=1 Tax=Serratia fonticola TaxID=47917 RepID=A0A4U9W4N2_SERFO|nr:Porin OmpC [Serratia fonticola]
MKNKMHLAVLGLLLPVASTTLAAEIVNKDGNKLDLYGQINGVHYFSDNAAAAAISPTLVLALKAKHKLMMASLGTASGNIRLG